MLWALIVRTPLLQAQRSYDRTRSPRTSPGGTFLVWCAHERTLLLYFFSTRSQSYETMCVTPLFGNQRSITTYSCGEILKPARHDSLFGSQRSIVTCLCGEILKPARHDSLFGSQRSIVTCSWSYWSGTRTKPLSARRYHYRIPLTWLALCTLTVYQPSQCDC